ncbi:MAG: mycofactocin biosynthesis glycosyltransferase MftF [Actinomycetota bacterium]
MSTAGTPDLAPGCVVEPSPDLRTVDGGRVLIGGAPLRLLRLADDGAAVVRRWFAGQPVGHSVANRRLARRLEEGGLAHIRWPTEPVAVDGSEPPGGRGTTPTVSIVVPTHDDGDELARTLASLPTATTDVVVVDDGSVTPPRTGPEVRLVQRRDSGGPGAARQTGLDATDSDLVVFVDAGVVLDDATLAGLIRAFDDPAVVAAAPRIRSEPLPHPVARYELRRSPLDLGQAESLVGPGRAVPYVPTACLAVRTDAVAAAGGFDLGLRYGEDVDLVWRLGRLGHVHYLPHLGAVHRPRPTLLTFVAQRRAYGSSAAPLALRHGDDTLAPCRVSGWTAAVVWLALGGRPLAAGLTAIGTGLALAPKLEPLPDVRAEAMALTLRGHWYGGLSIVTAVARSWAPLVVVAPLFGAKAARLARMAMLAGLTRRLLDGPRQPGAAAIDLTMGAADDLAYAAGLWEGAVRHRTIGPLRPVIASWPDPGPSLRSRLSGLFDQVRRAIRR